MDEHKSYFFILSIKLVQNTLLQQTEKDGGGNENVTEKFIQIGEKMEQKQAQHKVSLAWKGMSMESDDLFPTSFLRQCWHSLRVIQNFFTLTSFTH